MRGRAVTLIEQLGKQSSWKNDRALRPSPANGGAFDLCQVEAFRLACHLCPSGIFLIHDWFDIAISMTRTWQNSKRGTSSRTPASRSAARFDLLESVFLGGDTPRSIRCRVSPNPASRARFRGTAPRNDLSLLPEPLDCLPVHEDHPAAAMPEAVLELPDIAVVAGKRLRATPRKTPACHSPS